MATAVAELWRAVAGHESLVDTIVCFQSGQTRDMLQFVQPPWRHVIKPTQKSRDRLFRTWLGKWTASRVPKLFHRIEHMQQYVAEHAIRRRDLGLLRAVNCPPVNTDRFRFLHSVPGPLVNLAASVNDLNVLKYLIECGHKGYTSLAVDHAARHGNLEMVQYLHAHRVKGTSDGLRDAAMNGHVDVVRFLHEEMNVAFLAPPYAAASFHMNYVASKGHLHVLAYLSKLGHRCSSTAMDKAAANGHLDVVLWLHANRTEGCTKEAMVGAAIKNRLDIVQFLHENRTEGCVASTLREACKRGYLDMVEYLVPFCASTEALLDCINHAGSKRHLAIVQYILSTTHDSALVNAAVDAAAAVNDHDALKWLATQPGATGTTKAMDGAAARGKLALVQYLHEHFKADCSTDAIDQAAGNNHVKVVQWLFRKKPWRPGQAKCTTKAIDLAAQSGNVAMAQLLFQHSTAGFSSDALHLAVKNGHVDMLDWLHKASGPFSLTCTAETMQLAADHGHKVVLRWLDAMFPGVSTQLDVQVARAKKRAATIALVASCKRQRVEPTTRQSDEGQSLSPTVRRAPALPHAAMAATPPLPSALPPVAAADFIMDDVLSGTGNNAVLANVLFGEGQWMIT